MNRGVLAGNFDVIHPGYIKMFQEAKCNCDELTVLLHTDPSIERPSKLKPILTVEERKELLFELKSVDCIRIYTYEDQLVEQLREGMYNIRFLGDDYIGKEFTGSHLNIPVYYLDRSHGWSTTKFKKLIAQTL